MPRPIRPFVLTVLSLLVVSVYAVPVRAQTMGEPARYVANAVNMNTGAAGTVEIVVERWSTDAERDKLMSVMMEKGPEKLLDTLQDLPRKGFIRTPGSVGWDLHFARRMPGADGGERVVLLTDRRIGFWEARNRPRTIDYPFTFIELRVGPSGEGEGKISLATKIIPDKESNIITLENYDIQPVQLTKVRKEKK